MNKLVSAFLLTISLTAYAGENEQYWDAWHKSKKPVEGCASENQVSLFLQDAISNLGNAERTEANAEVIENVILTKPVCFLSALSALSQTQCKTIVRFFIEAPIFHSQEEIEKALKSAKPSGKNCYVS